MEDEKMAKLYIIGKNPCEDVDSRGKEGIFETLDNEHPVSLPNVEFERVYLPVICKKCGAPNILTAEDIEPVESKEREMGVEVAYSSRAYGDCVNCNENMEARITMWGYPEYVLQIFEVDEEENCKSSEIGFLDSLIEDIIWAQKYREENRE